MLVFCNKVTRQPDSASLGIRHDGKGFYMKDINNYTRVTEVLSFFSGFQAIDPVVLQNAANRGTLVHQICDAIIEGIGTPPVSSEISPYIDSFLQYPEKAYIKKPERFFCDELMITGECDAIYKEGDSLVLVDFKTSRAEGKTWALQGSAYAYLAKKAGYPIDRIEFVKLDRTGKAPKVLVYQDQFPDFLAALRMYRLFFDGKPPILGEDL